MSDKSYLGREIGWEIERRMGELGLTHEELTRRAGLSKSYVQDLIQGRSRNPRIEQLAAIADILGCTIADLFILRRPRRPGVLVQPREIVDQPDELMLLRLWRILTETGKEHFLRSAIMHAPRNGNQFSRAEGNDI